MRWSIFVIVLLVPLATPALGVPNADDSSCRTESNGETYCVLWEPVSVTDCGDGQLNRVFLWDAVEPHLQPVTQLLPGAENRPLVCATAGASLQWLDSSDCNASPNPFDDPVVFCFGVQYSGTVSGRDTQVTGSGSTVHGDPVSCTSGDEDPHVTKDWVSCSLNDEIGDGWSSPHVAAHFYPSDKTDSHPVDVFAEGDWEARAHAEASVTYVICKWGVDCDQILG